MAVQVTGWKFSQDQSVYSTVDGSWSNLFYIETDDSLFSTAFISSSGTSDWIKANNFGFTSSDIPDGYEIVGIQVEAEVRQSGATNDLTFRFYITIGDPVQLPRYSIVDPLTNPSSTTAQLPTSPTANTTTWGLNVTDSDIKSDQFGVVFYCNNDDSKNGNNADINYLKVRVWYDTPYAGGSVSPIVGLL